MRTGTGFHHDGARVEGGEELDELLRLTFLRNTA